ncbi:MAG: hypothetical protein HQL51_04040, partial [Magnetococcales bacterium]|nr:hypothetical protein [Magnetococcales bacterium]
KEVTPETLRKEVFEMRAEEAAKLAGMPKPSETYHTPALEGAAKAAKAVAPVAPKQRSEAERQDYNLFVADFGKQTPKPKPETPRERYARAMETQQRLDEGRATPEEASWLEGYRESAEFKAEGSMAEMRRRFQERMATDERWAALG